MFSFVNMVSVLLLFVVLWQDLQQRQISWMLIPALLALFVVSGLNTVEPERLLNYFLINTAFVALQLLVLTAYMSIKNKKWVFIINTYLGLGDVLFFVVLCAAFSPLNFIAFYTCSLFFAMLVYLLYQWLVKGADKHIPLAGILAALMMVLLVLDKYIIALDFYNDMRMIALLER